MERENTIAASFFKTLTNVQLNKILCTCGRAYNKRNLYNYHKKWECGKLLQCKKCLKTFGYRTHLTGHLRQCIKDSDHQS